MLISSNSEILESVFNVGYTSLVHHLEIVASFFPSCSANHLLVKFFSASTTFNLLIAFLVIQIAYNANVLNLITILKD